MRINAQVTSKIVGKDKWVVTGIDITGSDDKPLVGGHIDIKDCDYELGQTLSIEITKR